MLRWGGMPFYVSVPLPGPFHYSRRIGSRPGHGAAAQLCLAMVQLCVLTVMASVWVMTAFVALVMALVGLAVPAVKERQAARRAAKPANGALPLVTDLDQVNTQEHLDATRRSREEYQLMKAAREAGDEAAEKHHETLWDYYRVLSRVDRDGLPDRSGQ